MNGLLACMFEDCSVTCPDRTAGCFDACKFVGGCVGTSRCKTCGKENPPETGEGEAGGDSFLEGNGPLGTARVQVGNSKEEIGVFIQSSPCDSMCC